MERQTYGAALQVTIALALALIFAPVVRSITIELNQSVGQTWPFSMEHCHAPATPGCNASGFGTPLQAVGTPSR